MTQHEFKKVPADERWPLVAEAKATFGPEAAKQLAEKLGLVAREKSP